VLQNHQFEISDLAIRLKEVTDDYHSYKIKMEGVYEGLPKTINEVVSITTHSVIYDKLQPFVTKEELHERMRPKLDSCLFFDYCNRRTAKDDEINKQFILNDKFYDMQRDIDHLVTRDEFDHVVATLKSRDGTPNKKTAAMVSPAISGSAHTKTLNSIRQLEQDNEKFKSQFEKMDAQTKGWLKELEDKIGSFKNELEVVRLEKQVIPD